MSILMSYYFSIDLKLNLDFRPKNVCKKGLSTLQNSTLSRPPLQKFIFFTLQELRSLEAELYDKQREQRQTEERLKQREKELAEREIDLLERELNIMILQQVFNCLIC